MKYNSTVDFLLVTDQEITIDGISNLRVKKMNLGEFKDLAMQKLGMHIKLETPYKLCDYKEVWGIILENEVKGYEY